MSDQLSTPINSALMLTCSHAGPDCEGPLQMEHLVYGKHERTTCLCQFHNQTVQQIRRLLALRKRELGLQGKLDERQRMRCFEEMRKHRFASVFPEAMDRKCEAIAEDLGLIPRPDWYEQLRSQDTPKPGGPIKARLEPIVKGNPVESWEWKVTILNPEMLRRLRRGRRRGGKSR